MPPSPSTLEPSTHYTHTTVTTEDSDKRNLNRMTIPETIKHKQQLQQETKTTGNKDDRKQWQRETTTTTRKDDDNKTTTTTGNEDDGKQ